MYKEEILGKKPVLILEKIKENLEKLNEKMEVMIELQKHGRKDLQPITDAPLRRNDFALNARSS